MTKEELLEKLRSGSQTWKHSGPVDLSKLPTLEKQRDLILSLKETLESILESDLERLEQEREKLDRLRRGGGK